MRLSSFTAPDVPFEGVRLEILDATGGVTSTQETDPTREGPWLDWEVTLNELYKAASFVGSGTSEILEGLAQEWNLPADPADEDIPF